MKIESRVSRAKKIKTSGICADRENWSSRFRIGVTGQFLAIQNKDNNAKFTTKTNMKKTQTKRIGTWNKQSINGKYRELSSDNLGKRGKSDGKILH